MFEGTDILGRMGNGEGGPEIGREGRRGRGLGRGTLALGQGWGKYMKRCINKNNTKKTKRFSQF